MNIDFHVHGILSKKIPFNSQLFLQGIQHAKNSGLQGFVLCEHFNALDINSSISFLKNNCMYKGDRYLIDDFTIFTGLEIDIKYGGHIILVCDRNNIYILQRHLMPYIKRNNFIELEKLLTIGESLNCLMIGAHPYRNNHKLYLQDHRLLSRLHALDLNTKDIYKRGLNIVEKEVSDLAQKLNIPYVCGSDSHYPIQLGTVKTCFYEKEISTISQLKNAISNKYYHLEISSDLNIKVYSAKITKNKLKKKIKKSLLENEPIVLFPHKN